MQDFRIYIEENAKSIEDLEKMKNFIEYKINVWKEQENYARWESKLSVLKENWFKHAYNHLSQNDIDLPFKDNNELLIDALYETSDIVNLDDFWSEGIITYDIFCTAEDCFYICNNPERVDEIETTNYLLGLGDHMRCDVCLANDIDPLDEEDMVDYLSKELSFEFEKFIKSKESELQNKFNF